jgi:predicted dehydrogenase
MRENGKHTGADKRNVRKNLKIGFTDVKIMRIGIIGLGNQGKKRLKYLRDQVLWTVDPLDSEASDRYLSDLLLRSVDTVLVCVPDVFKFEYLSRIAAFGKNILVEKPLILGKTQFKKLYEEMQLHQIFIYEAFNHRFYKNIIEIKQIVDNGIIGEIYHCSYKYGNGTAKRVQNDVGRDLNLGVVSDLGSHLIDLHCFFFGDLQGTVEQLILKKFENQSYDYASFNINSKFLSSFEMSYLDWKNKFEIELLGEKGLVKLSGLGKWGNSILEVYERPPLPSAPKLIFRSEEFEDSTWKAEHHFLQNLFEVKDQGNILESMKMNEFIYDVVDSLS